MSYFERLDAMAKLEVSRQRIDASASQVATEIAHKIADSACAPIAAPQQKPKGWPKGKPRKPNKVQP